MYHRKLWYPGTVKVTYDGKTPDVCWFKLLYWKISLLLHRCLQMTESYLHWLTGANVSKQHLFTKTVTSHSVCQPTARRQIKGNY